MNTKELTEKIKKALRDVSKELQLHSGGILFVELKDQTVYLEFQGSCIGCPSSACGLVANFEYALKAAVPEISKIVFI